MFDTIGRSPRPDRARQAGSMALALLLSIGAVGGLWSVGARVVDGVVRDEAPIDITYYDLAPPPPPAGGAQPVRKKPRTPEPQNEPDPEVLPEEVPEAEALAAAEEAPGEAGGVEEGEPGGLPGGTVEGTPGGTVGAPLSTIRRVHWTEVRARNRAIPRYPEVARQLGLSDESCLVGFTIDERGRPIDVAVSGCTTAFADAAREAAWKWTFYPMKVQGVPTPARFELRVTFRLN